MLVLILNNSYWHINFPFTYIIFIGIVKSTKMPVKPVKAYPNKSFKQEGYVPYGELPSQRGYEENSYSDRKVKSNYEALSPMKRTNKLGYKFPSHSETKNYSFASNFK